MPKHSRESRIHCEESDEVTIAEVLSDFEVRKKMDAVVLDNIEAKINSFQSGLLSPKP